jgi:hypothetical protein
LIPAVSRFGSARETLDLTVNQSVESLRKIKTKEGGHKPGETGVTWISTIPGELLPTLFKSNSDTLNGHKQSLDGIDAMATLDVSSSQATNLKRTRPLFASLLSRLSYRDNNLFSIGSNLTKSSSSYDSAHL